MNNQVLVVSSPCFKAGHSHPRGGKVAGVFSEI
jgi:hypothetical protein